MGPLTEGRRITNMSRSKNAIRGQPEDVRADGQPVRGDLEAILGSLKPWG